MKTVKTIHADAIAFNSGLKRDPRLVDSSNTGTVSTRAKDIAPLKPAKIKTVCILASIITGSGGLSSLLFLPHVLFILRTLIEPKRLNMFEAKLETHTVMALEHRHEIIATTGIQKLQ